jgi:hypothetical protein
VTLAESEGNEARSARGTSESQVSEVKRTEIYWTNYPAIGGGYRRYPWHPAKVIGRDAGF